MDLAKLNWIGELKIWRDIIICEEPLQKHKPLKNNKAIAAIITSRARCKLYRLIQHVSPQGSLLYLDTDEIFIKPYNWLAFLEKQPTWTFYNQIEFFYERAYMGTTLLNLEIKKGIPSKTHTSYKRALLRDKITAPHLYTDRSVV
jgi:hypothetical protein